MIPDYAPGPIPLGPILLQPWGTVTAIAVFVAYQLFVRRANGLGNAKGVTAEKAVQAVQAVKKYAACLGGGALVSWFFASGVVPGGFSSVIAPLGGFAAATAYALVSRLDPLRLADASSAVFPFGWFLARLACALVHDHLGIVSSSWIAVQLPSGPRLDMGLLECLLTPFLFVAVWLGSRARRSGVTTGLVAATYAVIRFPLDFLRVTDPTPLGLTAAQWGCIPLFAAGLALLVWAYVPRTAWPV